MRLYSTKVSFFAFSLAKQLKGVVLGNDCDSASSFSFKIMLVMGEDSGGDCANILPALPSKEFGGDQHILWVLVFDGMGLAPLGWQINASPSSVIENKQAENFMLQIYDNNCNSLLQVNYLRLLISQNPSEKLYKW